MVLLRRYFNDLIVTLGADEIFEVRAFSRTLLRVTMASDQLSTTVNTLPITQYDEGTNIGNTGWLLSVRPTEAERADQKGIDHEIKSTPKKDIKGGTKR